MREIPVYLIAGFLDGGKTTFINDILEEGFADDGKTLVLCCEEGEEEYSDAAKKEADFVYIESQEDLNAAHFKMLEKKYRPKQIIIEYNGMWLFDVIEKVLPKHWILYQIMTFVDAESFEIYSANLGQLMMEKIVQGDMIVFNRCTPELKESLRKRNLRMINRRADMFLEDPDGKAENYLTGDECPFDMTPDLIDIPDEDYGVWYVDIMDHPDRWKGKTVHLTLTTCRAKNYPGVYCPGRFAMVCCAEDIQFLGIMATGGDIASYQDREWIEVTAQCAVVNHPAYNNENGPMLKIQESKLTDKPDPDVVSF